MTARTTAIDLHPLYNVRKGTVAFVDVPELGYIVVDGQGDPEGAEFRDALHALFAVSYGAHFLVKKERGDAPRVLPLEALWSVGDLTHPDRRRRGGWRWRAMIVQLDPIDAAVVERARGAAREKYDNPTLDRLRYERWEEGRCAQTLHVGPYADEGPTIVRLEAAIADAGCRPDGPHHEIYLGDPRRCAPERLRTILRQKVAPAPGHGDDYRARPCRG